MSAQKLATDVDDPLLCASDPLEAAREQIARQALVAGDERRVGLELEFHLVPLSEPGRRPTWREIVTAVDTLPVMPRGSTVSVEPGGQVELSTPPVDDLVAVVSALRADERALREALRAGGFGIAALGTDPARTVGRVHPAGRYAAMERHFDALGCGRSGRAMMTATAALQVNLDAGPAGAWGGRLRLLEVLVPVLVAVSATSPWLAGRTSGWHSMRRGTWRGIDQRRAGPMPDSGPGGSPTEAWASYTLAAPVMLDPLTMAPMTSSAPFSAWLTGATTDPVLARRPTTADLEYHLTTLFPPVRPRGYVELRCLDALPARWWPAVVALTVTLADDAVAADRAAELSESLAGREHDAARLGLADPGIRAAVDGCLDVALARCPSPLQPELGALASLVDSGRTPAGELRTRIEASGPLRVLEEEAHG